MKFAFMTFACPEWSLSEVLAAAQKHGYAGIEPRVQAEHAHGIELALSAEERSEVARRCEDAGVAIACLATSLRYSMPDDSERAKMVEETSRFVELGHDIGAGCIRVFGGNLEEGVSEQDGVKYVAESLNLAGEATQDSGIPICIETHDSFSKAATVAAVMEMVHWPNVQINWDIQHPYRYGETVQESFDFVKPRLGHTHFHDAIVTGNVAEATLIGAGNLPLSEAIRCLKKIGYDGYLSGEWWPVIGSAEETIPQFIEGLQAIEAAL